MNSGSDIYQKAKCPNCFTSYTLGFDAKRKMKCPACHYRFRPIHERPSEASEPVIMSDGRFLTNYKPTHRIMNGLSQKYGFNNSNDFRRYMQNTNNIFLELDEMEYSPQNRITKPSFRACCQGWRFRFRE